MTKKIRISQKNKKKFIIIGATILLIIAIIGVVVFLNSKKSSDSEEVEKEPEAVEEVKKLQIIDEDSTSRPYAIMINNINVARPYQSGLQDAYIIYEIIVEGGITRYMALFLDQDTSRIGSIRSARHYFLDYALENDAIYVHHGQSPQAQRDFTTLGVDRIEVSENRTGWRDTSLNVASEHRLFTSIEYLEKGIGNLRTEREGNHLLNYSVENIDVSLLEGAIPASSVSIKYSSSITSSYEYDNENQTYKRYVNGKEHTDYVTKEQYTFKNIITYQVNNYTLNDSEDKGRQELENVGSGTGYYISNGYAVPIKWIKSSRSSQTKYYLESGEELIVNDGNTFIQIQPKGESLEIS